MWGKIYYPKSNPCKVCDKLHVWSEACLMSVSRHEEASAGGGSFAQHGGLIAQQILPFVLVESPVLQLVPIYHQSGSTKTT